jgi:hypothetical protein
MKNVVYVLGAGFSAYAGLPVMSNFIDRAKDIYFESIGSDYKEDIKKVLDFIDNYSKIKNYMAANLFNIEELLSIAEMKYFAGTTRNRNVIKSFILGVIKHYEDSFFKSTNIITTNTSLLTQSVHHDYYLLFIYSLFNICIKHTYVAYRIGDHDFHNIKITRKNGATNYSLITFNYDMLLERLCDMVNNRTDEGSTKISFDNSSVNFPQIRYCKLHGSIDKDNIVPPTWAKFVNGNLKKEWQDAHALLKEANEIRIIGFSFPETDSHISYLFKSAIMENRNLKKIDVLCLDDNMGTVETKYKSKFITDKLIFKNDNLSNYFSVLAKCAQASNYNFLESLEYSHNEFFIQI